MRRSPAAFAAVAAACAASAWFVARSLQQDFAAYWVAGAARRLGLDPYLNQVGGANAPALWDGVAIFRHSRFLYPPLIADLFRPLAALPYPTAKGLFTAGMLAAWIAAGMLVSDDRRGRTVFFLASALFFPFYRHLERGQVDLLILLLLAIAWRARAWRPWIAGAALAAAMAFKPTLAGLLPVIWAQGRGRVALAALGAGALLIGFCAIADGPARLGEYASEVLPRAALYGEGGTEEMLLPPGRFPTTADDGTARLGDRRYRIGLGDAPAAASLPRLLAPEAPSPASARLPFVLGIGALTLLGRRLRRPDGDDPETLLYWAAGVACVVTSPTGWVMGLVLALPLAPLLAGLAAGGRLPRGPALAGAIAWGALALPAPFAGFPALAGAALIAAAALAAHHLHPRTRPA